MRHEPSFNRHPQDPATASSARRWLTPLLVGAVVMLCLGAADAEAVVSLAGVHDYSGDSSLLDLSLPMGERGWNVELVAYADHCNGGVDYVRNPAQTAKNHGLVNIIRVDYLRANNKQMAVPKNSSEYWEWANDFIQCTQTLSDLSNIFIVGNEPNVDHGGYGAITAQEYINAFNYLWGRKGEMPGGTHLLATFNSPFTPPEWMSTVSNGLNGTDGWAIHTGAIRNNGYGYCNDPRYGCYIDPNWWFDNAFRYYRDVINNIARYRDKPVYITEFNTYEGGSAPPPAQNYEDGWIQKAFEEIRNYNAARGSGDPQVLALCWFTDRERTDFYDFALVNIPVARQDMREEFQNPANHDGGGTTCPTSSLPLPNDRWRLKIWNNRYLSGDPVEIRYDASGSGGFNFNWGSGSASSCTGNDNFSILFKRSAYFSSSAIYTFNTRNDDGIRLWVAGDLILDRWYDQAPTEHAAQKYLTAGWHTIQMNYYEHGGGAVAELWWTGGGSAGNDAEVDRGGSSVPSSMAPYETRSVSVKVTNTGGTTWRASQLYRLGTHSSNTMNWSGWPCGGYRNSANDARIFLCNDVSPGSSYTFNFSITAPGSGTGTFAVRMVRDGVEWFGETESWSIPVSGGNPYPDCPCDRADNYCQHAPSTPGCPMTYPGGYCDPNGDGSYSDGDWTRGWYEYNDYCN